MFTIVTKERKRRLVSEESFNYYYCNEYKLCYIQNFVFIIYKLCGLNKIEF